MTIVRHRRRMRVVALAAAGLLVLAACEPLKNAPPGGGATVTETFRYGPITIAANGGMAMGAPSTGMPRPAGAFGLKSAQFAVVDAAGNEIGAEDVMLHHLVMTSTARSDQLCTGRAERFMGAGQELTRLDLWGPYAYLVGATDQWGSIYELMNHTASTKTVYIQYTLGYQPGANATNSRAVDPYFQDVTGCGASTFDVPGTGGPGSTFTKSASWAAPRDGLAVFAGGHLHDGGIDITLENTTAGKRVCKGTATYDEEMGGLETINPCLLHEKVTAGDTFTVKARYDNSEPLDDVMGIYMTYVWWGTQ